MRERINMTGRRIGRWLVLRMSAERDPKYPTIRYWECRCECGREATLCGASLRKGRTQSCGCLRRERLTALALTRPRTARGSFIATKGD